MSDEEAELKTNTIIAPYPNTYTFTKNLAENIISQGKGTKKKLIFTYYY